MNNLSRFTFLMTAPIFFALSACTNKMAPLNSETSSSARAPVVFEGAGFKILEPENSRKAALNLNKHKMSNTVCDPFTNGDRAPKLKNGIQADLYWLDSQCPRYRDAVELINHAVQSEKKLFFTDLFTPTRSFDKGFSTQTTDTLKDDQGQLLIEWFGLHFKSGLKLPAGLEAGDYELALLADDGVALYVKEGDNMTELIKDTYEHPTRMSCSRRFVSLSNDKVLNFDLFYSQGPRFHIANVLMWRSASKAPNGAGKDSSCGKEGNDMYFDPNNNSAPKNAYNQLLARGWNPVPAEAFVIPDTEGYNPCAEGTPPVVSNYRVVEIMPTNAILSWQTDIPATTQVRYRNLNTGETRVTETDNRLRTSHALMLTELIVDTDYSLEILATSEDNGRTVFGPQILSTRFDY